MGRDFYARRSQKSMVVKTIVVGKGNLVLQNPWCVRHLRAASLLSPSGATPTKLVRNSPVNRQDCEGRRHRAARAISVRQRVESAEQWCLSPRRSPEKAIISGMQLRRTDAEDFVGFGDLRLPAGVISVDSLVEVSVCRKGQRLCRPVGAMTRRTPCPLTSCRGK